MTHWKKTFTFIVILLFLTTALTAAQKKRVAVMNFANYGARSISFLKNALPESLSSSLSENKDIRVVERRQLGKLVNEIALEQTGLVNTRGVSRAGRLARADVLILGSVSGSKRQIIVTMKAVEVATGRVLDGKVVKASLGDVFDKAGQAAQAMAAIASGKGIGRLSISSVPSAATVYIDGLNVGKTPVVEYKLTRGEHRIKLTKNGFLDYEKDVTIKANSLRQISTNMTKDTISDRTELNFNISYFIPFDADLDGALAYSLSLGHTFERFVLSFEFGFTYFGHNQVIDSGPVDTTAQKRFLLMNMLAGLRYNIFPASWSVTRYFQPYAGLQLGYSPLIDYKKVSGEYDQVDTTHLFSVGAVGGFNLFAFARFSLFAEVKYLAHFPKAKRSITSGPWYNLHETTEEIFLSGLYAGGGARFYF